jgi:hypothetical protein
MPMPMPKALALAGMLAFVHPMAQAGLIEDLLAVPAIQALLGRLPELEPLVERCENVSFKQRNPALCQQAEQAAQLAKMPPELRAVMATPPAAASLRELCLAAIDTPAYKGYLCSELYKFDETFKTQSQRVYQENLRNRQMR